MPRLVYDADGVSLKRPIMTGAKDIKEARIAVRVLLRCLAPIEEDIGRLQMAREVLLRLKREQEPVASENP